jgi:hypothetical protein
MVLGLLADSTGTYRYRRYRYTDFLHLKKYLHQLNLHHTPVPEIIDPVFAKTSLKRSFSVIENELFGLVFAKTGSTGGQKEMSPILADQ